MDNMRTNLDAGIELSDDEIAGVTGGIAGAAMGDKKFCPKCNKMMKYTCYSGGRELCDKCKTPVTSSVSIV